MSQRIIIDEYPEPTWLMSPLDAILRRGGSCIATTSNARNLLSLALYTALKLPKSNVVIISFSKLQCKYTRCALDELRKVDVRVTYYWEWINKLSKCHFDNIVVWGIEDFSKDEVQDFIDAADRSFYFFGWDNCTLFKNFRDTMQVADIFSVCKFQENKKPSIIHIPYIGLSDYPADLISNYFLPKGNELGNGEEREHKSLKKPYLIAFKKDDEQINGMVYLIRKHKQETIGILFPTNKDVEAISRNLKDVGIKNVECRYTDKTRLRTYDNIDFKSFNPKLLTYYSAKGLNFDTVILPFVGGAEIQEGFTAQYIAMSCALTNLYIMYSGTIPTPFDKIPSAMYNKLSVEDFIF